MHPRIEPIIILLAVLMVFFTVCLFAAEHWFNADGQIFQVISGLLTAISGALLMRVKPAGTKPDAPIEDPQSSSTTTVTKEVLQAKE